MRQKTAKVKLPRELPVRHEAEVTVVGGGPGGIGAAVAAGRAGRDVLLIEHYGFLGGMATAGEVNPFMRNHLEGRSMDEGVYTDWLARIAQYSGTKEDERVFDPNAARLAAEDLCLEAGVRLAYHHRTVHVETAGGNVTDLVLHSKSGLSVARAAVFVDSTGDGDVCALAGCEFEYGGEGSPHAQPMTLCFKLKLDRSVLESDPELEDTAFSTWRKRYGERIEEAFQRAKREGRLTTPRHNVFMLQSVDPYVVHFNSTRVIHKSGIKGDELSEAEIEGRRQMRQLWRLLAEEIPIFRNSKLHSVAPQIGVRESRRILGRKYLGREDFERAAKFPDGIARVNYPIDIHSPDGEGTECTRLPEGEWYDVPFGCLLPRGVHNLPVGSRCISADRAVHASARVMPPVVSIGQAAGTAAAMAVEKGIPVDEVDGLELKARLIAAGRNLVPS